MNTAGVFGDPITPAPRTPSMELEDRSPLTRRLTAFLTGGLIFEEHEERIIMIIVWHVGSARQTFRRRHGIEGSLTAADGALPTLFAATSPKAREAGKLWSQWIL